MLLLYFRSLFYKYDFLIMKKILIIIIFSFFFFKHNLYLDSLYKIINSEPNISFEKLTKQQKEHFMMVIFLLGSLTRNLFTQSNEEHVEYFQYRNGIIDGLC